MTLVSVLPEPEPHAPSLPLSLTLGAALLCLIYSIFAGISSWQAFSVGKHRSKALLFNLTARQWTIAAYMYIGAAAVTLIYTVGIVVALRRDKQAAAARQDGVLEEARAVAMERIAAAEAFAIAEVQRRVAAKMLLQQEREEAHAAAKPRCVIV